MRLRFKQLVRELFDQYTAARGTSVAATFGSGTLTLNWLLSNDLEHLLAANITTFAQSNAPAAGVTQKCTLVLQQNGTGGFTTPDFDTGAFANVDWGAVGAPTMPSTADAKLTIWLNFLGGTNVDQVIHGSYRSD